MSQYERLEKIMHYLRENKKISVDDICKLYHVSRDSARRDLVKLEDARLLLRVHGGAILPQSVQHVSRYEERLGNLSVKKRIGQAAASLIVDGESILMDASTTVQAAAEALTAKDLVVLTNSIDIAGTLGKKDNCKVHILGGEFNAWYRNVTGIQTIDMLRNFRVQTLFLGVGGLTGDGLSSPVLEDAYLKREMVRNAERVVVLADHEKFQKNFLHYVCGIQEINILVTDNIPPQFIQEVLKRNNVQIIVAEGGDNHDN
ncbi:MAG: glcR [Firmicutes bacterium]|nr:glcR [Bacillota bacterium]